MFRQLVIAETIHQQFAVHSTRPSTKIQMFQLSIIIITNIRCCVVMGSKGKQKIALKHTFTKKIKKNLVIKK